MKKTISLALLLAGCALAQDLCVNNVGSGCGQWWMNSSTGVDGAYNHSTGVSTAYTANYTNITASQDPLNAIFSWTNNTTSSSNTAVTTNNFINVWSGLSNSTPTTTTTNNAASGLFINASDYSGYSNVSSFVPTNTGGSTPIMGGSTSTNSYEAYLAMIYGISYGSTPAPVNNSVVIPNADPIPEPASILTMGVGVAGLAVMAYRRRKNAAK